MNGNYINNTVNKCGIKVDFYLIKGVIENLLKYLGFKNRYTFQKVSIKELHPGISAEILIDRKRVGIIGKIHPTITKDDIYVAELSMTKLYEYTIKPLKFKESSKYPEIVKDLAFVIPKEVESESVKNQIKKSGGRLLDSVEEFDIYEMEKEKSIAYKLVFKDDNKTLSDEEVMEVFNKIIKEVETKTTAKLRS